ncbi:anti-sigma factor [Abyssalbus ytuae]|uniref:Anti-sigma factor n=1 Tax=Abyssalbus ytuae TaxID=2926907 RepID=A0A9E6ZPG2_9FLAO|nr:anti-sigma factor [Abyssalbus ytuae]UOB18135.1 anti-sigma factor [Abyssalbus ytuae]
MKTDLKTFLESDLLERYLAGTISAEDLHKVEYFIDEYPLVKDQFSVMEENLETYAKSYAVPAPEDVKQNVLKYIQKDKNIPVRKIRWQYAAAASFAALLFALSSIYLWKQNVFLINENKFVAYKIKTLQDDMVETNSRLEDFKNQLTVLNKAETKKYVIKGNQRAKNLKTVAYINPEDKLSALNIVSLPELPEGQVFQMWANVDGELVSLGVLEKQEQKKLVSIPYKENALSYNITIERAGGNEIATIENQVATVALQ